MQLECVILAIESSCADVSACTGSGCTYNLDYVLVPENAMEKSCLMCRQYCEVQISRQSVALPPSQKRQQCFRKMVKQKKKKKKYIYKRGKQHGFHSVQIKVENPHD